MDNFSSAVLSVGYAIRATLLALIRADATWGFFAGFLITTGLYAIIMSDNPRHIPLMLSKSAQDSFAEIHERGDDGRFCISYTAFQREYNRVRTAFYLALFALLVMVIVAMFRFQPA